MTAPAATTAKKGPPPLPADQAADRSAPPEEQFWHRYSPHGEAPISFGGSLLLHFACFGVVGLFAIWLYSLTGQGSRSVNIEPVSLMRGGGGGKQSGKGDGPGVGTGVEDVGKEDVPAPGLNDDAPKLPNLTPAEKMKIEQNFDPADARIIADSNNESARALARLEQGIRRKLSDGLQPGKGQGGAGSGGGKDRGVGKGEGPGIGDGKQKLSQREKRMLRWHMRFTAATGQEYVAQLKGLGAILAIPVKEVGPAPEYMLVEDLNPPAKLVSKDLTQINRIYWIDDKPSSVKDVMAALGLDLRPSRFVAFMPEKLEAELYRVEKAYVEKVLRRTFDEDKIDETNFKVEFKGGKYVPELMNVSMRR